MNLLQHRSGSSVWERPERIPAGDTDLALTASARDGPIVPDPLDAASEESFPASDAPARTPVTGSLDGVPHTSLTTGRIEWALHERLRQHAIVWACGAGSALIAVYLIVLALANSLEHATTEFLRLKYWMTALFTRLPLHRPSCSSAPSSSLLAEWKDLVDERIHKGDHVRRASHWPRVQLQRDHSRGPAVRDAEQSRRCLIRRDTARACRQRLHVRYQSGYAQRRSCRGCHNRLASRSLRPRAAPRAPLVPTGFACDRTSTDAPGANHVSSHDCPPATSTASLLPSMAHVRV